MAAVDLGKQDDESEFGVTPVFVVQVKDADAAEKGLEAVLECAIGGESADSGTGSDDSSDTFGWSIRGGWAVIAETDELAESVTDAAADAPLSGDDDFKKWTGEAGDHGVLTAYAAPEAGDLLAEAVTSSMLAPEPDHSYCSESSEPGDDVEPCDDSGDGGSDDETQEILKRYFEDFEGAGLQVRFADGGVEVESASSVDLLAVTGYGSLVESEGGDDVVATLPDDTAAAIGVGFEPGWVEALLDSYESLLGTQMNFDDLLQTAEDELGLDLPEDAEALLGESAALAVGPGIDPDAEDPSDVDVAVKIKGDPDRIAEVLDKLRDNPEFADDLGDVLDYDTEGQHVVVGPAGGYREDLLDDGNLGDTDKYEGVIPESGRAGTVVFVDVDAFDDLLEAEEGRRGRREPRGAVGGRLLHLVRERRRPRDAQGHHRRLSGAVTASVTRTRSSGASSRSKPRRPPDTNTVACASAESSTTVGCGRFCPTGEMPPTT